MNCLRELGLGALCEDGDSFVNVVLPYVVSKGDIFQGYYGRYFWARLGNVELNVHISPGKNGDEITGFTSNVSGDNFMNLAVTTNGMVAVDLDDWGDTDYLTRVINFTDPETHEGNIAINLVNADVAPDFYPDDRYTLQVVAIAYDVDYYKDEESYVGEPLTVVKNEGVNFALDNVVSFFSESVATGHVLAVNKRYSFDGTGKTVEFYSVEINTPFGVLEILHSEEAIKDGQKGLIKPGSVIKAQCTVFGDIAVGEYSQGAIFDEQHLVRLLRGCLEEGDFTRISKILADDCKYITREDAILAEGRDNVLAFLSSVAEAGLEGERELYAYPAEIIGYDNSKSVDEDVKNEYKIGTYCIAVAYGEPNDVDVIVAIKLDENNRIKEIKLLGERYAYYQLRIDFPQDSGIDFSEDDVVKTSFTENEWIKMLAIAYAWNEFEEDSFYYGLANDCTVESEITPDAAKMVCDRESLYAYLSHQVAEAQITVMTISGETWGHENVLKVAINGNSHICVIDVNEEGHMQKLKEYRC